MTKASDIALALSARLAAIQVANGFNTDIGLKVFRGKRALDADVDVPCVVIVEGNDTVLEAAQAKANLSQRYQFEAHVTCDPDHPNDAAHLVIEDLKRAIFSGQNKYAAPLDGLVKNLNYKGRVIGAREDGIDVVFAGIHVDAVYPEDLTNP
ncbi:hypothetical protein [Cupriavidus oxalaticus]|uniref:Uncharacterized protein n=1 Tax=Cupriavidus oxalaticus TaxID=96344 RepID=A0A976BFT1_9BURK|nr:hypothetical protein [Cupriavidus oxalaticus]QRQ86251.1 hypothetical protein JTE91_23880 [Cupriavidus oxalaticus]QRQ95422.1 hypothetical protein JTE92_18380 [Cupriavidus oxalaticus]WQD84079.1 hypothetical protein U0036_06090 [Cupriavidus oxalaticus]SPC17393.1 conserved exported hypothetical protein [Cupriavidus oxalaticus]